MHISRTVAPADDDLDGAAMLLWRLISPERVADWAVVSWMAILLFRGPDCPNPKMQTTIQNAGYYDTNCEDMTVKF
jgi:hypothetical protein